MAKTDTGPATEDFALTHARYAARWAADIGSFETRDEDEECMLGHLHIPELGLFMHVDAIRVTRDPDTGEQVAVKDPYGRLDDAYAIDPDTCYQSITLPGFDGEWVLVATPYGT